MSNIELAKAHGFMIGDHHAFGPTQLDAYTEAVRADERAKLGVPAGWRCFHCSESFTDFSDAQAHFGTHERHQPACQIDAVRYRQMEARMESYNQDDSDMHRQLYAQESRHQIALRREEEAGYAKGLRDAKLEAAPQAPTPPAKPNWSVNIIEEPRRLCLIIGVQSFYLDVPDFEPGEPNHRMEWFRDMLTRAMSSLSTTPPAAVVPTPPFGSIRAAALALYKPPFNFQHGYIKDAGYQTVADHAGFDGKVKQSVAARVRGWVRIGHLPDAVALQDEVGAVISDALTEYWIKHGIGTQGTQEGGK